MQHVNIIYSRPYEEVREACHAVKTSYPERDKWARILAANLPAWDKVVLIPVPGHEGYPSYTHALCCGMAITYPPQGMKMQIFAAVTCEPRESLCSLKEAGEPLPDELRFDTEPADLQKLHSLISLGYKPIVIDNVIDTGRTAKAMQEALGVPCAFMCIGATGRHLQNP